MPLINIDLTHKSSTDYVQTVQPTGVSGSWTLSFQDEFDGSSVSSTNWQTLDPSLPWRGISKDPSLGGTSSIASAFSNTGDFGSCTWDQGQVSVSGGIVTLNQNLISGTQYGGGIVSRWPLHLGFYEARVKFTSGFPAWWIVSHELGSDPIPQNPAVSGTEMDLAEGAPFGSGSSDITSNVHWNGYGAGHTEAGSLSYGVNDANWHIIGFWWTTTSYRFYVDGVLNRTFTTAIAANPGIHYMLLNNAFWSGNSNGTAQWDYVRHWTGG